MEKNVLGLSIRRVFVVAAAVIIACVSLLAARPDTYHAKAKAARKTFKTLKIGSKNLTKDANTWDLNTTGSDGAMDFYLNEYSGVVKKGSKLKVKVNKGYKAKMYFVSWSGAESPKRKKIKNNFKLPTSDNNWFIEIDVKRGKTVGHYFLSPESVDDDE